MGFSRPSIQLTGLGHGRPGSRQVLWFGSCLSVGADLAGPHALSRLSPTWTIPHHPSRDPGC